MPECSAGVPISGSLRTPKPLGWAVPAPGWRLDSARASFFKASSWFSASSSSLTLVSKAAAVDGDQRTTDPLLAVFAVDRKPGILERVGDLVRSVVSVCRKCRDAVHLLLLDAAERLVDGDEQFVGMIGC